MLLDTNVVIYSGKPGGGALRRWTSHPHACVSIAGLEVVDPFEG